ncbi:MAG: endonuclease/exonuclease/phosphatase family protein, partial [Aeromicrobium sp.]|uniref:endonuclease/exonuclease/phosphatase family protein n=1 Tax=Aeromicrobium sp. TaxID=1871063 RepID=UPI004034DEEC
MYRYLNTTPTPPPAAIPTTPPPPTANLPEHPGPHPQHNTLPTRQPQPTHNRQHITLTTLNVRSLHRSRNDVLNLVHQHSPDILILTETMTQPRSNNTGSGWLKRVMPDYTTHRHRGHSEVLIGIKHNLAIQMKATMLPPSIDAEVNARCV